MNNNRLIIFDIDGTLLHTGGAGLRAFKQAAEETLSCSITFTKTDFAGKLDCNIFSRIYSIHSNGNVDFAETWHAFTTRYIQYLKAEAKNGFEWKVYPGVREFVERESKKSLLSLLTGNIKKGAELKLKTVGLWDCFPCGAFGDEGPDRNSLAVKALQVSEDFFKRKFDDVWVIGDTVADIECGKKIGAKTIGVRTGFSRDGELEAAGANFVVRTLADMTYF